MSEYVKLMTSAGDQYLAALAESQTAFLKTLTAFSGFSAWAPPAATVPVTPLMAGLPTPQEVSEANFAFVEKLLEQQKDFTDKLLAKSAAAAGAASRKSR